VGGRQLSARRKFSPHFTLDATDLAFYPLMEASAFKPFPTGCDAGAERVGSE
jgi:hypothetical protein